VLDKYQITSKLVWECHQSLVQLARQNRAQLSWYGCWGMRALLGMKLQIIWQKQDLNTCSQDLNQPVASHLELPRGQSDWMNKNHIKQWESLTRLKQAKELIVGPSVKRSKDLLKLNRDQLRWIVGLLTGHCYLKGHLFKVELIPYARGAWRKMNRPHMSL
jgi:hypothetical protein